VIKKSIGFGLCGFTTGLIVGTRINHIVYHPEWTEMMYLRYQLWWLVLALISGIIGAKLLGIKL
jgi:hypothetical protein